MFWYEELYGNKDLTPTPTAEMSINGKPGKIEKVDDLTVRFVFPDPYPGFIDILTGASYIGTSQSNGATPAAWPDRAEALPLASSCRSTPARRRSTSRRQAAGFDNWKTYFTSFAADWRRNVDLPVLMPWKMTSPINTPNWVMERNPFYYGVDTEGNQLPYIDKIQMTLAENLEVLEPAGHRRRVRLAGAPHRPRQAAGLPGEPAEGQLHRQARPGRQRRGRHLADEPVVRGRSGGRGVAAEPRLPPCARAGHRPRSAQRDVLARYRDARLDRAGRGLALQPWPGVSEEVGHPGRGAGEQAAGRDRADPEGRRGVPPAEGRQGRGSASSWSATAGQFISFTRIGEMIAQHLKRIGIQIDVVEQERTLMERRRDGNELQTVLWANDGSEMLYSFPPHALPMRPGRLHGEPVRQVVRLRRLAGQEAGRRRRC